MQVVSNPETLQRIDEINEGSKADNLTTKQYLFLYIYSRFT